MRPPGKASWRVSARGEDALPPAADIASTGSCAVAGGGPLWKPASALRSVTTSSRAASRCRAAGGLGSGTLEQSFDHLEEHSRVDRLRNKRRIECGRAGITAVDDEGDAARLQFIAEVL